MVWVEDSQYRKGVEAPPAERLLALPLVGVLDSHWLVGEWARSSVPLELGVPVFLELLSSLQIPSESYHRVCPRSDLVPS